MKGLNLLMIAALLLAAAAPLPYQAEAQAETAVQAEKRGLGGEDELSGEPETSSPQKTQAPAVLQGPAVKEPERSPAGGEKGRPVLKLPEVVVKGEREFRITAERKDMLYMDPMRGAKETPDDMAKVAIPGLDEQKVMPSSDTVTAKNYLFTAEGGAGSRHWAEGRLVAGLEMDKANAVLRGEYNAMDYPDAFGITPFDQWGNASLDIGVTALPGARFSIGFSGKAEGNRQPAAGNWGEWLERLSGNLQLGSEFNLTADSKVKLLATAGDFLQQGTPADATPALRSVSVGFKAGWEYSLQKLIGSEMDLLAEFSYQGADSRLEAFSIVRDAHENLKSLSLAARFRPVSILMAEIGVRADDFRGVQDKGASSILGRLSLSLPTETTLYGSLDGGLNWETTETWAYLHPRPSVNWVPAPEEVKTHVRAGLQQRFGEAVSLDAAWFLRDARNTLAWIDPNADGLFDLVNLPQTRVQGLEAELEINYSHRVSQKFSYTYRQLEADNGQVQPNTALQEARTELRVEFDSVMASLDYHYLGARYADPGEQNPSLEPAHLAGARMDIRISPSVNVYAKLENLLNDSWEKWKGYPGRNISYLAGLRIVF